MGDSELATVMIREGLINDFDTLLDYDQFSVDSR